LQQEAVESAALCKIFKANCINVRVKVESVISKNASMYKKHFSNMYRDVGMAVLKTTESRCRDGSVQEKHK